MSPSKKSSGPMVRTGWSPMSDWGPGAPSHDSPLSPPESVESESDAEQGEEPDAGQEGAENEPEPPEKSQEDESVYGDTDELFEGSVQDAMNPGEFAFLPVFGFNEANIAARKYAVNNGFEDDDTVINIREDEPLTIGGRELTWWEDNSIMPKHQFMLVNPLGFASVDPDVHNFREVFRCSKGDQFVFSDSGGYQLMSMNGENGRDEAKIVESRAAHSFGDYHIYPERLVEWQVENADAGATIDFPPYNISGDSAFPDSVEWGPEWFQFFRRRKTKSADMTERMATRLSELRDEGNEQAEDYIFAPVIHGKPHPEEPHRIVDEWHEAMSHAAERGGIDPRAWVLKPEPSKNMGQIAMFLGYAYEHLDEADFIHVLMVGGLLQKTLLMYYAMHSDHFVTSDASSYAAGGMRRQFFLPKTATRRSVIISSRDDDDENAALDPNHLTRYPCRCQVCSTVEDDVGFSFISEGSGSARSVTLNLHNLQQILNVECTLDALLREDDANLVETGGEPTGCEFWRYVKNIAGERHVSDLYRAMDYLRIVFEDGLDAANNTYRIKWSQTEGKTLDRGVGSAAKARW